MLQEREQIKPDVTCSCKQSPSIAVIFNVGLACSLSLIPPWFSFSTKPLRAIVIPEESESIGTTHDVQIPLEYLYILWKMLLYMRDLKHS